MRRSFARSFAGLAVLLIALCVGAEARAQDRRGPAPGLPVMLIADEMTADEDLGVVTAQGNVEVSQGERILRADTLTFNQRTNVITAAGNVSLVEPTGEVAFAEFVELTSDFREGVMRGFRILLADQSRFAAVTSRRADGSRTVMRRATYSACEPCERDPSRPPIWQIRAARITHDTRRKEVVYDDAWLEIAGVPVAYTPYLSHPDSQENRSSGLLIPEVQTSSNVGTMLVVPYFQTLGPSADATLMPAFIWEQNSPGKSSSFLNSDARLRFMPMAEYRRRFAAGSLEAHASWLTSYNYLDREGIKSDRGHIDATMRFDLDDNWRWGLNGLRASDKTYMERYRMYQRFRLVRQEAHESRLYVEGFQDRGYASLEAFGYQSVRPEDDPATSPIPLPVARYSYVGTPQSHGGYWTFDASGYAIHRLEGLQTRRATAIAGWHLPYTTTDGSAYRLSATLQNDAFHTADFDSRASGSSFRPETAGFASRALPQIGLEWRRPLARIDGDYRTILEPVAAVYLAPNIGSQRNLPNEESRTTTFDEMALFRMNRFPGADRLESGARFVYGLNATYRHLRGGFVSAFLGQQLRSNVERALPEASGFNTRTSDYVGRFVVSPHSWSSLSYRFQADDRTGELLRQVLGASFGPAPLQFTASYIQVDRALQPTALRSVRQISYSLNARIDENWRMRGVAAQSLLDSDPGLLFAGTAVTYEDECFFFEFDALRRNIGRTDVPPDTSILFRIGFRTLGAISLRGL
jgi:LPS-assembly protein